MPIPNNPNKWRIGTALAGLRYFRIVGIREPMAWQYDSFSVRQPQSTGGEAVHGYKKVVISWPQLSAAEYAVLKGYIDAARAGAPPVIYLTINRNDGAAAGADWIDVSGYPGIPDRQPLPRGTGQSSVTWIINNLTIETDPAVV